MTGKEINKYARLLNKEAEVNIAQALGSTLKTGRDAAKDAYDIAKQLVGYGAVLAPVTGLAVGYGTSALASPDIIAGNSDRLLTLNNLKTEVAVTNRRLQELMRRKAEREAAKGRRTHDQFI